jgi:hypothetical protein
MTENPTRVPISQVSGQVSARLASRFTSFPFSEPALSSLPALSVSPAARVQCPACIDASALGPEHTPPSASYEAQPGHTFHLGRELSADPSTDEDPPEPFGDTPRAPVPNAVLDDLSALSGCAVRLCVVMMRDAYTWTGSGWKCSASYQRRTDLRSLGMSAQSVRNAADELESRGWLSISERGGAHAYRWRLSVPRSGFTFLPLGLLLEHERLSHSGLTVLLSLYRATWGWTTYEDGSLCHEAAASLSISDLADRTGLSASTVRSAASEVIHNGAAHRTRPGPSRPYSWSVNPSFFGTPCTKSEGGTTRERKVINKRARARKGRSASVSREIVGSEGEGEGEKERATQLSEREKRDVNRLMSEPFSIPYGIACKLVNRHSAELLQASLGMYRQQYDDIRNPGGWLRAALENRWAAGTPDKTPDVQHDDTAEPMTDALKSMKNGSQGGRKKSEGGVVPARNRVGMTYDEMTNAVHELRGLTARHFLTLEHDGTDSCTFVPNLQTARWAWRECGDFLPAGNRAAKRMVQARKEYEESDRSE